jgi:RHS repeat-associated protein
MGGNNPSSAIRRFRFEALAADGQWLPILATVTGAQPAATPGWFETVAPTPHLITATYAPIQSLGVRVLMDAGGGSPAHPNRLMVNEIQAFATTPGGPIAQQKEVLYGYDANGNQTSREVYLNGTLQSAETFGYDYANRLAGYLRQDGGGATQAHYEYLATPLGDRLAKSDLLAGTSEWYMLDGRDVVADYVLAGGTFTVASSYLQALSLDSKWVRFDASGAPHYYLPDALGSVGRIVGAGALIEETRLTTAWGEDLLPVGPDRHGFTQRERDAESGLLHFRARMYDPRTGRFVQTDPLLGNRSVRHYLYASNNPAARVDPLGTEDLYVRGNAAY